MRLATFRDAHGTHIGAVEADRIVDLSILAPNMLSFIDLGAEGLAQARKMLAGATTAQTIPLSSVTLVAPIPRPRKNVVCLGMNYAAHAYESARWKGEPEVLPKFPVFFTKATTSINDPNGIVPLHQDVTQQLDWEVELALVLGRVARQVARADALDYVFGYTVLNDVSARDLQTRHQQFFRAKSLDGCCPLGPWIVTADEIPNPHALGLRLRLNGQIMQDSQTGDQIFTIQEVIETLSHGMTLEPGDIIATGTPAGVGVGRRPPVFLKDGDVVEAEVDGIGILRNTVKSSETAS